MQKSYVTYNTVFKSIISTTSPGLPTLVMCLLSIISIAVIQYLRTSTSKEEGLTVAQGFRHFNPWSVGSVGWVPMVRQNILEEVHRGAKVLTSWQPGSKRDQKQPGS